MRSGMRQIVDHLVEVHHINDMAFVGGVNGGACARGTDADDVVSRYDAFKKYLEERGLDSKGALLDDSFATSDEYMVGLYILHRDVLLYVHEVLLLLI